MRFWQRSVLALSSALGLGYLPLAPGTWGSVAAIPLWWAMRSLSTLHFAVMVLAISFVAIVISEAAERIYGRHDVQKIVIDEVAGLLVTAIGVPFRWHEVAVAFVLFRVLDSTEPWPVSTIDRRVKGGLGVVLDDVAAGVVGCGLLHLGRYLYGGWW